MNIIISVGMDGVNNFSKTLKSSQFFNICSKAIIHLCRLSFSKLESMYTWIKNEYYLPILLQIIANYCFYLTFIILVNTSLKIGLACSALCWPIMPNVQIVPAFVNLSVLLFKTADKCINTLYKYISVFVKLIDYFYYVQLKK